MLVASVRGSFRLPNQYCTVYSTQTVHPIPEEKGEIVPRQSATQIESVFADGAKSALKNHCTVHACVLEKMVFSPGRGKRNANHLAAARLAAKVPAALCEILGPSSLTRRRGGSGNCHSYGFSASRCSVLRSLYVGTHMLWFRLFHHPGLCPLPPSNRENRHSNTCALRCTRRTIKGTNQCHWSYECIDLLKRGLFLNVTQRELHKNLKSLLIT